MINDIYNGDSASEIRAKLNEMIKIVNDYSSSQYMGPGPGGDPAPGGDPGAGGGADSISLSTQGMAGLTAEATIVDACGALSTGYSNSAYIQKDAGNMGGTAVPEVNDWLYEDSSATMPLSNGYYGWYDMTNMMNKAIEIGPAGVIVSITGCA